MRYAETGYNLEIDLARGNIERVETDPELMKRHLGGLGTSVKLHWDRVPPETKPFDPENLLVFSSGLFCGTPAFSANRTVITFNSPQTGLLAYPMMGGFWASELKYAGYDKVILRNKSPKWMRLPSPDYWSGFLKFGGSITSRSMSSIRPLPPPWTMTTLIVCLISPGSDCKTAID